MDALPSYADAPFHVPPDIVLDLPAPPSVNRLRLIGKGTKTRISVTKSVVYRNWIREADALAMATGQFRGLKSIRGKFEAIIILKRSNVDLDNHSKGLLDWLQSRNVIENDKYCERLTLAWGDAPAGCRVTVRPCA